MSSSLPQQSTQYYLFVDNEIDHKLCVEFQFMSVPSVSSSSLSSPNANDHVLFCEKTFPYKLCLKKKMKEQLELAMFWVNIDDWRRWHRAQNRWFRIYSKVFPSEADDKYAVNTQFIVPFRVVLSAHKIDPFVHIPLIQFTTWSVSGGDNETASDVMDGLLSVVRSSYSNATHTAYATTLCVFASLLLLFK